MSDRNLPEPQRAMKQWMANMARRLSRLERTASHAGSPRVSDFGRVQYLGTATVPSQPTDGYWASHVLASVNVEAGSWLVNAWMQFEIVYTFIINQIGYEKTNLSLYATDLATGIRTEELRLSKAPMAHPTDRGSIAQAARNRIDQIQLGRRVSSENGLKLELAGMMEINGGAPGSNGGSFWLGPGQLLATPL
jgi:hypothetical protein